VEVEFEWSRGALARGLAHYNNASYFEAHEEWEDLWRQAAGLEKTLLQALIQLSVAFCHRQRGNPAGFRSMLGKSIERFKLCPDALAGLEVSRIRAEAEEWFAANSSGSLPASPPRIL
jgi:hypothetical protein